MDKKRYFLLPATALVGGLFGVFVRIVQLDTARDPMTGLFDAFAPASILLLVCLAATAVVLFILRARAPATGYLAAFRAPNMTSHAALETVAGFLFVASAGLHASEVYTLLQLWRYATPYNPQPFPAIPILTTLCLVVAGVAVILLARGCKQDSLPNRWQILTTLPAFAALCRLVYVYQTCSNDPVLLNYVWLLLCTVCTVLAFYYYSAFAFGRGNYGAAVFFSLMAVTLGMVCAADGMRMTDLSFLLAATVHLLSQSTVLLRNAHGPSWPRRVDKQARMPRGGNMEQGDSQSDSE